MTAAQFKEARRKLGLSAQKLADLIGVADGRTIRRWEAGEAVIFGPVAKLMNWLAYGVKPKLNS